MSEQRSWLARRVFPDGEEPDPRFTLANERTFLAWTRTSLAFLAGGIALEAFAIDALDGTLQAVAAVFMIVVGLLISLGSCLRWIAVERSMRHDRPLPVPGIIPVLSIGGVCGAVVLLVGVLV
ncbi:YidH family protein [Corynebacterium uterequi]|uniref:Putative membrane protein n=1 Tax=Corynebacterium uterequi TaxID=1072256 RepID=A0A0G3HFU4_9CORY|nr:DUF202 domain-containing protein [Corynebacterium uterequi]AKK12159.1 putative membrane protein [Corynebacterium uterequi]